MKLRKMAASLLVLTLTCQMGAGAIPVFSAESVAEAVDGTMVVDAAAPIDVTGGQITGTTSEDGEIAIYKGIPYAAQPVGDLRWKAPVDVENWDGIKACEEFGPCAWQDWPDFSMPWMTLFSEEFFPIQGKDTLSEDCLYLNVWTKQGEVSEKRPVVVFIHGGGFGQGSGSIAAYDGTHIAEDDIVFVNFNYRIGVFGFMTSEELDADSQYGTSGNYGIVDCIKALEWVRDNIEKFGGDPDNVTIAGQSAGGMAVEYLISAPLAAGLFKNAFVMSGNYIRPGMSSKMTTKEEAQAAFKEAYPDLTLEDLRSMPEDEVYANIQLPNKAIVDGGVIREDVTDSLLNGNVNDVNLLFSWTDGDIFEPFAPVVLEDTEAYKNWAGENFGDFADELVTLYPAVSDEEVMTAYEQAMIDRQIMSAASYIKLYNHPDLEAHIAYITHEAPADTEVGMFHTGDIPYWFGGTLTTRAQYETETDHAMYQTMKSYFENFIKTGNPNGEGLNSWDDSRDSEGYLLIGDDTYDMENISAERAAFWEKYFDATSLDGALAKIAE